MDHDHAPHRRPGPALAGTLLLLGGCLGLTVAAALGVWSGSEVLTTSLWRVESVVAPVVVAVGAAAAASLNSPNMPAQ